MAQNDPPHRRNNNHDHPHPKTPRQMLEAKLHETIRMACEEIVVRKVLELEGWDEYVAGNPGWARTQMEAISCVQGFGG